MLHVIKSSVEMAIIMLTTKMHDCIEILDNFLIQSNK